ncbi:molecular chaperone TorD family protein [Marinobacter daepoensis]|uniref:molecular chaperone TorD family protein n=1 Tax=Marinobacter daepoensis TaxID=262077 RepID=UPI001C949C93|nr:molecular chaperone TorD family protein [Marinobacter daepoensis]MBY6032377.1 molecular chaperone TorD family protein [Marinobacter daepoensis]
MFTTEPAVAANARGALFRIAAALLDYPLPETRQVLVDGRALSALTKALHLLGISVPTGAPARPSNGDLESLQVGYTNTFLSGRKGNPRVPLMASAYKHLMAGSAQGSFLLNIQAFYKHFGLKAAERDEGHVEEPDHLVAMLEFCTLLCHLEERACDRDNDPGPYQRAQRDFLTRYLTPLTEAVRDRYQHLDSGGLEPTLAWLVRNLPEWCMNQQQQLTAITAEADTHSEQLIPTRSVPQGLWD